MTKGRVGAGLVVEGAGFEAGVKGGGAGGAGAAVDAALDREGGRARSTSSPGEGLSGSWADQGVELRHGLEGAAAGRGDERGAAAFAEVAAEVGEGQLGDVEGD